MDRIELSQVIEDLRSELSIARNAALGSDVRFDVGPVEIELNVAVSREGGASGKAKFWVVELGGDARLSSSAAQKIKLTLTPRSRDGHAFKVSGEAAENED